MPSTAKDKLGSQIWLEPTDSQERVDQLFKTAADTGLGWIRLFLIWPWIEANPGQWDFTVFDYAFAAAKANGIQIKATLTCNSGPWHIGTPSTLHSHSGFLNNEQRAPMARYIEACVTRYAQHPALGQWLLWNEPCDGKERTDETRELWSKFLEENYSGIDELNTRWRTGYKTFYQIPFCEELTHLPEEAIWTSYRPFLDDCRFRAHWLVSELEWVKATLRDFDPITEVCVNPTETLANQAARGTDIHGMANLVDIIGASYHPCWQFNFAPYESFPALMSAGIQFQRSCSASGRVEVTEVQTGNTVASSNRPREATPDEIARFYLACLATGAESVTGWCFNTRSYDFEAGDWALLDDMDAPSERSLTIRKVHDLLERALPITGRWHSAPAQVHIPMDPRSQAVELRDAEIMPQIPGRCINDNAFGSAMLAAHFKASGVSSALIHTEAIPEKPSKPHEVIAASHLICWEQDTADRLLAFAEAGGTVFWDATCGRKDYDATLHRPWPGGVADKIGLRAKGMRSSAENWQIELDGQPAGEWLLARMDPLIDEIAGWTPWPTLTFAIDGAPCVYERSYGKGKLVIAMAIVAPALYHSPQNSRAIDYIINQLTSPLQPSITLVDPVKGSILLPIQCAQGALTAIITPNGPLAAGQSIKLNLPPNTHYLELWTNQTYEIDESGRLELNAVDGIALLYDPKQGHAPN